MRKWMIVSFAFALLACTISVAQSDMKQDTTQQNSMKSDKPMKTSVMGKISDDGKTFVSDKDGKSWTIDNPDAVKGHEGHHVILKASVDPDKNEVHVMSLKMAKNSMSKDDMQK